MTFPYCILALIASTSLVLAQDNPSIADAMGLGYDYANCTAMYQMLHACVGTEDTALANQLDSKGDISRGREILLLKLAGQSEGQILTLGLNIANGMKTDMRNSCDNSVKVANQYYARCKNLIVNPLSLTSTP